MCHSIRTHCEVETVVEKVAMVPPAASRTSSELALVISSDQLAKLPVLPGVERLIILVDHDINGAGQLAAAVCTERWTAQDARSSSCSLTGPALTSTT